MSDSLAITVVGSGTSTGVPVLGCPCAICKSENPKNRRTRPSIAIKGADGTVLWVDTGPDFREQGLRYDLRELTHVFYTHTHADHCHGFDDLRAFYFHSRRPVRCYVPRQYAEGFRQKFPYAFGNTGYLGTSPQVELEEFEAGELRVGPFLLDGNDLRKQLIEPTLLASFVYMVMAQAVFVIFPPRHSGTQQSFALVSSVLSGMAGVFDAAADRLNQETTATANQGAGVNNDATKQGDQELVDREVRAARTMRKDDDCQ